MCSRVSEGHEAVLDLRHFSRLNLDRIRCLIFLIWGVKFSVEDRCMPRYFVEVTGVIIRFQRIIRKSWLLMER